jgi:endoglucanase
VARGAFDAIREREPDRTVVMGSNHFCHVETFDQLDVPEDDHLILTFHFYEPMLVTHYRAMWNRGEWPNYTGPIFYPGDQVKIDLLPQMGLDEDVIEDLKRINTPYDQDVMRAKMQKPLAVRERTGCPLYCGEFGAYHTAPQPIREAWFSDLVGVFEENDIAWASWDYKGGFGLFSHELQPDQGVINILFGDA